MRFVIQPLVAASRIAPLSRMKVEQTHSLHLMKILRLTHHKCEEHLQYYCLLGPSKIRSPIFFRQVLFDRSTASSQACWLPPSTVPRQSLYRFFSSRVFPSVEEAGAASLNFMFVNSTDAPDYRAPLGPHRQVPAATPTPVVSPRLPPSVGEPCLRLLRCTRL